MAVLGELLFYRRDGADLDAVLRHHASEGMRQLVERIPETAFGTQTDDELIQRVLKDATVQPLDVHFDKAKVEVKETEITVQDYGQRISIKGLRAQKTIPFVGDRNLWNLRTNPYDMSPPRGDVRGDAVVICIEVREDEGDQAVSHLNRTIDSIKEYLKNQENQIEKFNSSLPAHILPHIQARRARLNKAADLLKKLEG